MTILASSVLHLAVALDGAGWHPAAWREPDARPRRAVHRRVLDRPGRGGRARAARLRDDRGLARPAVRPPVQRRTSAPTRSGPARRGTDRRPGRPADRAHRARADRGRHPHRAVPRVQGHRHPGLRQHRPGRGAGPGLGAVRDEAALFGRRTFPRSTGTPSRRRRLAELFDEAADYVEVVRRLWDSWEDDAEIRDAATGRFIDRDKLHYIDFDGRAVPRQRTVDHAAPAAGPADRHRARAPDRRLPALAARAPTSSSSRRTTSTDVAAIVRRSAPSRPRPAGRTTPCTSSPTCVVFLDDDPGAAAARRARLDDLAGAELRSDARIFTGTPVQLADLLQEWHDAGLSRLPAASGRCPARPGADHPRAGPRAAAPRCLPHRLRGGHAARPARPAPSRQPLRRRLTATTEDTMSKPRKQIHLAAHFPGVNNTTVWSDPARRQPHRVRVLRPLRADRRAGEVRLPLPGRGPAAARAERADLRPRRGRPARTPSPSSPRWPRSPSGSGSPARSTRRSTSRTRWPASSPRSTTSPRAGRRGTS